MGIDSNTGFTAKSYELLGTSLVLGQVIGKNGTYHNSQ
jgi:hypothetical protein